MTKARRLAAAQGRPLRIMFADEARFGRMNRPRPCWAPKGVRPEVPCQLIREFTYLYGAVCPNDGTCVFLILPAADTECFQIFLDALAKKYPRSHIVLFVDGAGNHISGDLARIIHHLLIFCGGCSAKWPIHIANRCLVELLRATAEGHSRHDRRYSASL